MKALYDSFGARPPGIEYSLKLDGKDLSHLSPGERGTLLLVFYLLVDKSNKPIIVDQPEENLDSQTMNCRRIPIRKHCGTARWQASGPPGAMLSQGNLNTRP